MEKFKLFYDNQWWDSKSKEVFTTQNPCTKETIAEIAKGDERDVELAIQAASKAFESGVWSELDYEERADYLHKVADVMESHFDELVEWEAKDTGKPIKETREIDIPLCIRAFRYHADSVKSLKGQVVPVPGHNLFDFVTYEPYGVVGSIAPWNFPLHLLTRSIAAALAAGNTVVCKPSTDTPVTAHLLGEIFAEAGVPAGVYNVISGSGSVVGEALLAHDDVKMVALTGSEQVGRNLMISSAKAKHIKKLSLELGGKSAMIVDENCNFDAAVNYAIQGFCSNQGEVCVSTSRLLLPHSIYEKFLDSMEEKLKRIKIGNCLEEETQMGSLINEKHLATVQGFVDRAKAEGAKVRCGGKRLTGGIYDKGSYYQPTIVEGVTAEMEIFNEEVFGPVLAVTTYETMDEAVKLANQTRFALGAAIITEDIRTMHEVTKKLDAGTIWINCVSKSNIESPFGGNKNSGLGREDGLEGLLEYMKVKNQILYTGRPYEDFFGFDE